MWLSMSYEDERSSDEAVRERGRGRREDAERKHEAALDHAFEAYERLLKAAARLELEGPDRLIPPASRLADLGDLLQLPGKCTDFDEDAMVWVTEDTQQPFTWITSQFGDARAAFVQAARSYFNNI
ncbi:hypothetical protein [Streptomyces syringium]|uniref:hypothetical protein n=1 Tax=Streptomyces syringium TaxID=76729 RepID=UPI0037D0AECB